MQTEMTFARRAQTAALYVVLLPLFLLLGLRFGAEEWWEGWTEDLEIWRKGDR